MRLVRSLIVTAGVVAIVIIIIGVAHAQSLDGRLRRVEERLDDVRDEQLRRTARIGGLERRMELLEAQRADLRLTRLEAYAETNRTILIGVAIAVAAQTAEMLLRTLRRKPNG